MSQRHRITRAAPHQTRKQWGSV